MSKWCVLVQVLAACQPEEGAGRDQEGRHRQPGRHVRAAATAGGGGGEAGQPSQLRYR